MDSLTYNEMYQAANIIEARETMTWLKVSDYPHLQKEPRKRLHQEIFKQAYPKMSEEIDSGDRMKTGDIAKVLGSGKSN